MYRTDLLIASTFALCGFAAAMVAGAAAGNPSNEVIGAALGSMFVCYAVGYAGAKVALIAINEHIAQHKASKPVPETVTAADAQRDAEQAMASAEAALMAAAEPAQESAQEGAPESQADAGLEPTPTDTAPAESGRAASAPAQPRQAA